MKCVFNKIDDEVLKHTIAKNITEYFVSEKLDGVRAYWDGNNLVTRSGKKIHVPQWFVSKWPETPLDGELWSKRGDFQNIVSCIRRLPKNQQDCWQNIRFHVFDLPAEQDRFEQRVKDIFRKIYFAVINEKRLTGKNRKLNTEYGVILAKIRLKYGIT